MKVFLTGGTGFVGREVQRQLLRSGHKLRILCHSQKNNAQDPEIEVIQGDATDPDNLTPALEGCDAVINLIGIIREFPGRGITFERLHTEATRNLIQAAKKQGVGRFLQMSANGTRSEAVTGYHKTKWAAEQLLRDSGLDWTIFRPSLIFGADDMFVNMLAGLIRKLPVVPVMGDGKYRLQPVAVEDVAAGFVKALDEPRTFGKTYHCGGPRGYSYNQILDMIGVALGKKSVCKMRQPLLLMKPVVAVMQSLPQFPMTSDQLQMLLEENICDPKEWQDDLQLELTDFEEGISRYLS